MADDLFSLVSGRLEEHTDLDRLEARGTLRLALKSAGVNAKAFTLEEIRAVFARVLPAELASRGIEEPETLCSRIMTSLVDDLADSSSNAASSRDEIIRRLGSG